MMILYSLSVVEVPSYQRIHHHINIVSCIIKSMSNNLSILLRLFCPPTISCMHRHYSEFANSAAALMYVPTVALSLSPSYSPLNILEVVWRLSCLEAPSWNFWQDAFAKLEDCDCCDFQFAIIHCRQIHLWSGPLPIATCQYFKGNLSGVLPWDSSEMQEMQVMLGVYTITNSQEYLHYQKLIINDRCRG